MRAAGVERVTLQSGSSAVASDGTSNAVARYHLESEAAIRASDLAWTFLQPNSFMSNTLQWRDQLAQGDTVAAPFAGVAVSVIDPRDIAAVAARALTAGDLDGRLLRLSGPEALRPADRLQILGEVLGRDLTLRRSPTTRPGPRRSRPCRSRTWTRSSPSSSMARSTRRRSTRPSRRFSAARPGRSGRGPTSTPAPSADASAARHDERRDRHEVRERGRDHEHVEDLVEPEDGRARVRALAHVDHRAGRVQRSARHEQSGRGDAGRAHRLGQQHDPIHPSTT